jgi:hypothetical protein
MYPQEKGCYKRCSGCNQLKHLDKFAFGGDAFADGRWPFCVECKLKHEKKAKEERKRHVRISFESSDDQENNNEEMVSE